MTEFYYQRHVEREILSALLDGELPASERRYVHDHLQDCSACREAAEELGQIQGMIGGLPRLVAPEAFVSGALEPLSGVRVVADRAVRGRTRWVLVGAVASALAVTLSGLFAPPRAAEPPVDTFVARHVSMHDGTASGGQVLFGVTGSASNER